MAEIKVNLIKYSRRKFYYMCFEDPITNKRNRISTGETRKAEALKVAGKWEAELNSGTYHKPLKISWQEFTDTYLAEAKIGTSAKTTRNVVFNHIEKFCDPKTLANFATARKISEFQNYLKGQGKPDTTIGAYLSHLKAVLNWARRQEFLKVVPEFEMPKIPNRDLMRGRSITGEEFDRMIEACKSERPKDYKQWQRFLRALWFSGLRLSEALCLSWDQSDSFCIVADGKRPQFRIFGEAQKSGKSELLPMAKEFWDLIADTPGPKRNGLVLPLPNRNGNQYSIKRVSKIVSAIGRAALIVTNPEKKSFASAHDLRRSFGERWAKKIGKPLVLQKMMRHTKIETTLRYYANLDTDWITDEIWQASDEKAHLRAHSHETEAPQDSRAHESL